jgi:hypothetical protein
VSFFACSASSEEQHMSCHEGQKYGKTPLQLAFIHAL